MSDNSSQNEARQDRRWVFLVSLGAMALTMVPYLIGFSLTGVQRRFGWFCWLGYNLDDSSVYLAWMRQVVDGRFFQLNLFTTNPQVGHQFNIFFVALGWIARFTHVPLIPLYHLTRIVLGFAFLRSVWWLLEMLLADRRARRLAFLITCFSAGVGWLPGLWQYYGINSPVDGWQPEAVTFLCLYLSPLFLISLLLMVGVIGWLFYAERTGEARAALYAGLCGFFLGNIHTYDIITLVSIWLAFVLVRSIVTRHFCIYSLITMLAAGLPTALSCGYMLWLFRTEAVFAKRVAVNTLSPPFIQYVLGYGLIMLLALVAAARLLPWALSRRERVPHPHGASEASEDKPFGLSSLFPGRDAALLVIVWAVVNLAVAYVPQPSASHVAGPDGVVHTVWRIVPVPFQRKMLMGEHLPLSILAACTVWALLKRLQGRAWTLATAGIVAVLVPSNIRFMLRDAEHYEDNLGQSRMQRPFLYPGEVASLNWIEQNVPHDVAVQPLPWITRPRDRQIAFIDTTLPVFVPGLTGHAVNAGHWGETPDFGSTMMQWVRFQMAATPDASRRELLRRTGVKYLIFSQKDKNYRMPSVEADLQALFNPSMMQYLRRVPEASNEDADVYEVVNP